MLDAATLREMLAKILTPRSRRQAVTWAIEQKGYSQRRACGLVGPTASPAHWYSELACRGLHCDGDPK